MSRDRIQALNALIAYDLPIEPVLDDLGSFGWDSVQSLVILSREDIVHILDRYLTGKLTAEQVTDWADLIECREDIGFPEGDEELLSGTIFRLANPYLRDKVTLELVKSKRRELDGA